VRGRIAGRTIRVEGQGWGRLILDPEEKTD
jgi:hypothetical protein